MLKICENVLVLVVECRDKVVKMIIGRKSNYYYESIDVEIVEEIIGKYSLENEVESINFIYLELV